MMRVRTYDVLARAVEEGVAAGWRRACKHSTKPPEQAIRDAIEDAVLLAISDVFDFDERSAPVADHLQSSTGLEGHILLTPDPPCPPRSSKRGRRDR